MKTLRLSLSLKAKMKLNLLIVFIFLGQLLSAQVFTEALLSLPFDGVSSSSIAFADVDGDNDQDVLITGSDGSAEISKLYINDGLVSSIENVSAGLRFEFILYPNPTKADKINVSYTSEENGALTVRVVDLNGHLLRQQQERLGVGQKTFSIDIATLHSGCYFIQLDDGKRKGVQKILVQ